MKLLIASDIHGSLFYCKKIIEKVKQFNIDKIILLGDLLYHGPRNDLPQDYNPKEVAKLLNIYKDKIIACKGNCDSDVDQMVLDFPIMSLYNYFCVDNLELFLTHGDKFNKENLPPVNKNTIIFNGHFHVSECTKINDNYYINPGSVSIPKGGTTNSFIVYENKVFTCLDFDGNEIFKLNLGE